MRVFPVIGMAVGAPFGCMPAQRTREATTAALWRNDLRTTDSLAGCGFSSRSAKCAVPRAGGEVEIVACQRHRVWIPPCLHPVVQLGKGDRDRVQLTSGRR